jgi:hypothetical protein
MRKHRHPEKNKTHSINEDWLAVFLAFLIILLSAIGLLGPNGLNLTF